MSLSSLLTKISNVRGAFVAALGSKGVELASSATLHDCASAIRNISVGYGGVDVTFGYVSAGVFHELTFSGTSSIENGSSYRYIEAKYNLPGESNGGQIISGATITSSVSATSDRYLYTTVNSGGHLIVADGILFGAYIVRAENTTVNSGGNLSVLSGGHAYGVEVNGGSVGASGTDDDLESGTFRALAYIDNVNITHGAMAVKSFAQAQNVQVASGASLTVSSGGTALAVTSQTGAVITVENGGYIEYANQ